MNTWWWHLQACKLMLAFSLIKCDSNANPSGSTTKMPQQLSISPDSLVRLSRSIPNAVELGPLESAPSLQALSMEPQPYTKLSHREQSANGRLVPSGRSQRSSVSSLRTSMLMAWTSRQRCAWPLRPCWRSLNQRRTSNSAWSKLAMFLKWSLRLVFKLSSTKSTPKEKPVKRRNVEATDENVWVDWLRELTNFP